MLEVSDQIKSNAKGSNVSQFDAVEQPKKWKFTEDKLVEKFQLRTNQAFSLLVVTLVLFYILSKKRVDSRCRIYLRS